MSDTFSINEHDQVVPYTSGRRCHDTREWRDATDLELQQRDDILGLERDNQKLLSRIADLEAALAHYRKQYAELVEAVERASKTAYCSTDLSCVELDSDDWQAVRDLADKLKEQQ